VTEPLDIDTLLRELRYMDNNITVAAADEIERLRARLAEAIELAAEAIPYAGEYFDDKWSLSERLAAIRGPQDEEAAEICPHDREPDNCCQGYDSDCEGPRRAGTARPAEHHCDECGHVGPASAWWADGTAECARCAYVRPQRSGTARPEPAECDAEDDWCFTHDRKHFRCYTANGTVRLQPAEECPHPDWSFDRTICVGCDSMPDICVECGWHDCRPLWSDLCAGAKGYENEPDCGVCWGCQRADQTQEGDR
jgi:hypothetical protein